jgi:hypothetical protein
MSKLVLYAALSTEVRDLLQDAMSASVRRIVTTAFTERATSMKYRGLFDLLSRKEKDGRFQLQYGAQAGQWSLAGALELWRKRHG